MLAATGTADVISAVLRGTILQATVTDACDLEAGLVASAFTPFVSVFTGGLACIIGVGVVAALMPAFVRYRAPRAD